MIDAQGTITIKKVGGTTSEIPWALLVATGIVAASVGYFVLKKA